MGVVYCVAHVRKFKKWSLEAMEKHLNRTAQEEGSHTNYDINPELTPYNVNLMDREEKFNEFKFIEKYKDVTSVLTSKPRKDAVAFFSVVVSASPEYFNDKTLDQIENYFEAAKDFLMDFYGPENCVGAYIHFDEVGNKNREASPHMHFIVAPLKEKKLCCFKVITRNSLRKLQDNLPKYLQARGFNIQRGVVNSPRYHIDTSEWKRDELIVEATKEILMEQLNIDVEPEKKFFGKSNNVVVNSNDFKNVHAIASQVVNLIKNNSELVREKRTIKKLREDLEAQQKNIFEKMQEQQKKSEELLEKEKSLENYKKVLEHQDKSIALQKLLDDVLQQQKLLDQKSKRIDKQAEEAVLRVREAAKKQVMAEVEKLGTQGKWANRALQILKESDPDKWNEIISIAGKEISKRAETKVEKNLDDDLLLPRK